METGYSKADSRNLPDVDTIMIHEFYCENINFVSAEIQNVKAQRSTRSDYGDDAIGFVQLKRDGKVCTVKAKVTPEHKIREKGYDVVATFQEDDPKKVLGCKCEDCSASEGGCKHGIVLLFWLYRRSSEKAPTSVECYWKTSKLATVGKSLKSMSVKEMFGGPSLKPKSTKFLETVLHAGQNRTSRSLVVPNVTSSAVERTSVHFLILEYLKAIQNVRDPDAQDFIPFCTSNMKDDDILEVENVTTNQHKSTEWFEARYCRITASKLHEISKCTTKDGSLVEVIFGSHKVPQTEAMQRGTNLEDDVRKEVEKQLKIKINKCGILLNKYFPLFGASPDGINENFVIEIKCPSQQKTLQNYISKDGTACKKPYAQIQLQMLLFNKQNGLLCVAAPSFESDKNVHVIEVPYNKPYCKEVMTAA